MASSHSAGFASATQTGRTKPCRLGLRTPTQLSVGLVTSSVRRTTVPASEPHTRQDRPIRIFFLAHLLFLLALEQWERGRTITGPETFPIPPPALPGVGS